jgi:excisionase family DNA binding protein
MTLSPSISIPEIAELTDLSESSVRKALRNGEIPAQHVGDRWVISRDAFEAWMSGGSVEAKSRAGGGDDVIHAEIERIDIEIKTLEYKRKLWQQRLGVY